MHDQGRVTVLKDVPSLAPYFFLEPDYSTAEAQVMRESMSKDDYREHWPFSIASLELN
jgi:glutamyl-tRNA synthetase